MTPLEPDRAAIEVFVNALLRYAGGEGFVSVRSFYENDSSKPFRISPVRLNGNGSLRLLVDVVEDDARRAANYPRSVVLCPPLAVFSNKDRAREADLLAGLALSVELDDDPTNALGAIESVIGPATCVVRSRGATATGEAKLHAHWRLARPAQGENL